MPENTQTNMNSTTVGLGELTAIESLQKLQSLEWEINRLNALYARALDERRFDLWPDFFIPEGRYTVRSRENHERGLPLALIDLESQGMMKDRIYGATQTIFHAPYYTRHVVSSTVVLGSTLTSGLTASVQAPMQAPMQAPLHTPLQDPTLWVSSTSYSVFRTKPTQTSEVFNVGQYLDHWTSTDSGLKLVSRLCVYDSEMVLNSFIYPI
jgi:salicylate 5-hydroxylase small subunit